MVVRRWLAFGVALGALVLAACAGRTALPPAAGGAPAAVAHTALDPAGAHRPRHGRRARIKLFIPRRKHGRHLPVMHPLGGRRGPHFISSGTASIEIAIASVDGGPAPAGYAALIANLTPSSPGCSSSSSGTTCSLSFLVPEAAAVVLDVSLYSQPGATGSLLASGTSAAVDTATPGAQFAIVLNGVPTVVVASVAALAAYADGTTHVLTLAVGAQDASGATITQPGDYAAPIVASVSNGGSGAIAVSPATIASPGPSGYTTVTVTYDTAIAFTNPALPATITFTSGSGSAAVTVAPLNVTITPASIYSATGNPQLNFVLNGGDATAAISEPGYAGTFTQGWVGRTDIGVACAPASCAPAAAGGTVTMTLSPQTLTTSPSIHGFQIGDANGASASLTYAVTGASGLGPIVVGPYTIDLAPLAVPSAEPEGLAVGPNGKGIWVADTGNQQIGRFVPSACATSCTPIWTTLGAGTHYSALAAGGDGNLYAVGSSADLFQGPRQIELVGHAGCDTGSSIACPVVDFAATSYGSPVAIVRGNDFQMHFVDDGLATSPPSGAVSTFPYPAPTSSPPYASPSEIAPAPNVLSAIANGPGDTLFTTDNTDQHIGTMDCSTTCTTLTESSYSFGSGTVFGGITLGSDGNMWVALPAFGGVAYFAPSTCCSGSTVHYLTMPYSSQPQAITSGPDGNIWFTARGTSTGSYVGMIDVRTDKVTEMEVSTTQMQLDGITTGPDGNVWFTAFNSSAHVGYIGKVVIP